MLTKALVACVIALLALAASAAHAGRAIDDRGEAVELSCGPQRIVSLLPSLTETLCVIGQCDRLVGVDTFSNWPAQVRALPHVGGLDDANIEMIVALRPGLVLLSATSRARERLEALGVKVFVIEPRTLQDVRRTFERLGQLLDAQPQAQAAWAAVQRGLDEAVRSVPPVVRGTTVYFEVDSGPYAASEGSHVGEILSLLGAANVVPARLGSVPKLNPEFVVRADPQVIVVPAREAAGLASRPGWGRIRAIREGRVCTLGEAHEDVVARPGPRIADAARVLAHCLMPPRR